MAHGRKPFPTEANKACTTSLLSFFEGRAHLKLHQDVAVSRADKKIETFLVFVVLEHPDNNLTSQLDLTPTDCC
jgi:hypothetical protein